MKLLYTKYLNDKLIGARIVVGKKATYSYLNFVEENSKLELKDFKNLKINSNMNLLEVNFINNGGNHITHRYELFEEIK